ncbi:polyketide cyclase/dehydrase/lipid transport protein [Kribbella antiqua]|uniref:Polyketide cyclase/dehydrase/lipid transport protein n=1 Tax=Kribbella antiqua TaxID=2512217 RepID=A0A4R2I3H7_9ACTN|nr:SRPBCC family protein [Kribbella antiqua]TCO38691.1 polyketide cyclase/dehydrase/lipid transport protein [Kribbella antiqua]
MWVHEHAAETAVPRQKIWAALADIDSWTAWDTSMAEIKLDGPFAVGSTVSMTPIGQDPIRSTIVAIDEGTTYADETVFGGTVLRFSHTLSSLPGGLTRIVHRLEISDDETGAELGPMITADFPEAMEALIAYADNA